MSPTPGVTPNPVAGPQPTVTSGVYPPWVYKAGKATEGVLEAAALAALARLGLRGAQGKEFFEVATHRERAAATLEMLKNNPKALEELMKIIWLK